jgi:hypothetical protein
MIGISRTARTSLFFPAVREKIASAGHGHYKNIINIRYLYIASDAFGTL